MFHHQIDAEKSRVRPRLSPAAQMVHGMVRDRSGIVLLRLLSAILPLAATFPPRRHTWPLDPVRSPPAAGGCPIALADGQDRQTVWNADDAGSILPWAALDGARRLRGRCARHARQRAHFRATGQRPFAWGVSASPGSGVVRGGHA